MPGAPAGPLVDVAWLAAHAGDAGVRVVDCRWYLGEKRGADAYAAGHLPGAVFVDLDTDLSGPKERGPGRHPLPSVDAFADVLARIGVGPETIVVAYDDAGGAIAARLWWMLRWVGHAGGRVLDGGVKAWVAAGHALSRDTPAVAPAPRMSLTGGHAPVVDKVAVDRLRRDPSARVLDARAAERYEGRVEPVDARPGHVPGARSLPFAGNLDEGGRMLPRDALRARYADAGALDATTVVAYCGSGVTACHDVLALAIAGRDDAALYEGSWSDWSRDAALPAATGPEPGG
ncbi:MAG TPA: sulfurtransferase [Minicystis sp.]|nr:sulfurtransferase [Minicystis sp.]